MKVLVIGGGAREHALCRALRDDPAVTALACAPGNAGTELIAERHPVEPADGSAVAALAHRLGVDLVLIGPEGPLVAGVADVVRAQGIACFGPSAAAARLEGSKAFAKDVMAAADVPTARSYRCDNAEQVGAALDAFGPPYVVKDDGLAAGKGVLVTPDRDAAMGHAAGRAQVIVEEYLDGPEVSLFAITDGECVLPLLPAQDFKRARAGDVGPNTGGMGAYCPLGWAPESLAAEVTASVLRPTVDEMRRRGTPFRGLLYAGLALTSRGTRVVEFNARFGDPETQVVLASLATPLAGVLHAAAAGSLRTLEPLRWREGAAVTVVVAAENYPGPPVTGDEIGGITEAERVPGVWVLHAGAERDAAGVLRTAGGRVLSVTATGDSLAQARERAYQATRCVTIRGSHFRDDIAGHASLGVFS